MFWLQADIYTAWHLPVATMVSHVGETSSYDEVVSYTSPYLYHCNWHYFCLIFLPEAYIVSHFAAVVSRHFYFTRTWRGGYTLSQTNPKTSTTKTSGLLKGVVWGFKLMSGRATYVGVSLGVSVSKFRICACRLFLEHNPCIIPKPCALFLQVHDPPPSTVLEVRPASH